MIDILAKAIAVQTIEECVPGSVFTMEAHNPVFSLQIQH
jgi:hypothetical protein